MREYIILIVVSLIWLGLGFLFGRFMLKRHRDGSVVIELTEDKERERVRFVLDLDLDEIKYKNQLVLKVENNLSQNKQAV